MGQIRNDRKVSLGRCKPMSAQRASHLARVHFLHILLDSSQKTSINMDESFFLRLAAPILDRDANPEGHGANKHFRRFFGVSPIVVALAFDLLVLHGLLPPEGLPIHLLWACGFVRQYSRESVLTSLYGACMNTIRHHMWPMVMALAALTNVVVSALRSHRLVVSFCRRDGRCR